MGLLNWQGKYTGSCPWVHSITAPVKAGS
jgi:hypothetical protein